VSLRLFAFVHLNLAFSSIEEAQRPTVIECCYWPLLRMVRALRLPLGVEVSGYTLEVLEKLDPRWMAELRSLMVEGVCELIGCGYSQLIGPLVPAAVNDANQLWGHEAYQRLLGVRPTIALVNEQAYAAGLVPLYREHGYEALIMEWNNPASAHPEWMKNWRYLPQRAVGPGGDSIALIWNESVAFQKFQRYAHGETDLDEYLTYIRSHAASEDRAFPVYGNDVEIFDFRPGRFMTESPIYAAGEWRRIEEMFAVLLREPGTSFVKPSGVLSLKSAKGANQPLRLESAAQPIPVKKQGKYNVLRWAVTGRDDIDVNTRCWRLHQALGTAKRDDPRWKELCYLWSSDMRTHITASRWSQFQERLARAESQWGVVARSSAPQQSNGVAKPGRITLNGKRITVTLDGLHAVLNRRRGLALDSLHFTGVSTEPLCGTVPHGTFDDTRYSPDWYTGDLVFERPAQHKVTDLEPASEFFVGDRADGALLVRGVVQTPLGPVTKALTFVGGTTPSVGLDFEIDWPARGIGSLRLALVTLVPGVFDDRTLYYRTHNGGRQAETYALFGTVVDHGSSVSALVSAGHALGVTEGTLELGDAQKALTLHVDKTACAVVGMVEHRVVAGKVFCQMLCSAGEIDDTRKPVDGPQPPLVARFTLTARKNAS
jgi:hypothetical protein